MLFLPPVPLRFGYLRCFMMGWGKELRSSDPDFILHSPDQGLAITSARLEMAF